MDSIPWEKAKLSEFGKNRTACYGKRKALGLNLGHADGEINKNIALRAGWKG